MRALIKGHASARAATASGRPCPLATAGHVLARTRRSINRLLTRSTTRYRSQNHPLGRLTSTLPRYRLVTNRMVSPSSGTAPPLPTGRPGACTGSLPIATPRSPSPARVHGRFDPPRPDRLPIGRRVGNGNVLAAERRSIPQRGRPSRPRLGRVYQRVAAEPLVPAVVRDVATDHPGLFPPRIPSHPPPVDACAQHRRCGRIAVPPHRHR